jgi:hypothetical protein
MQRIAPVIASVVFGGLAVAALSACGAGIDGTGVAAPAAYHANTVVQPTSSSAVPTSVPTPVPTSPQPTHGNPTPTRTHTPARTGITADVRCVIADYEDLPGMPHTPLYQPKLTWHVTHATGMALSVDNPGLVGSYGTYGASGTLTLGGGCYTDGDATTITFYSVGSTGPMVHKTVVLTPTMTRPTAPPLANTMPNA